MESKRTFIFQHDFSRMTKDNIVKLASDTGQIEAIKNKLGSYDGNYNESDNTYFNIFLFSIKKLNRSLKDIPIIVNFLKTMTQFVIMIKKNFDKYKDVLNVLAQSIKYEFHQSNKILFQTGEKGENFYLILQGNVNILVAKEIKMNMTEEEYYSYLIRLKKAQEEFVLNNCLWANRKVLDFEQHQIFERKKLRRVNEKFVREIGDILSFNNKKDLICYLDYKDYIEKTRPIHYPENLTINSKLYELRVWQYFNIVTLTSGEFFGDNALISVDQIRTATVMTKEDCHLGIITQLHFNSLLKDAHEKQKNINLTILLKNQIFSNFSKKFFKKYYYNLFVGLSYDLNKKVITEGSISDKIYIIKSGEFQISFKKSMIEIGNNIKSLGGSANTSLEVQEMMYDYPIFDKKMNEKRIHRISIVRLGELVGLDDMVINDTNTFTVECISSKGEVLMLEKKFLKIILEKEDYLCASIDDYINKKKVNFINRLTDIRDNNIAHFMRHIKDFEPKTSIPIEMSLQAKKYKFKSSGKIININNETGQHLKSIKLDLNPTKDTVINTEPPNISNRIMKTESISESENSKMKNKLKENMKLYSTIRMKKKNKIFSSNLMSTIGTNDEFTSEFSEKTTRYNFSTIKSKLTDELNNTDENKQRFGNPLFDLKDNVNDIISNISVIDNHETNNICKNNHRHIENYNSISQIFSEKDRLNNIKSNIFANNALKIKSLSEIIDKLKIKTGTSTPELMIKVKKNDQKLGFLEEYTKINEIVKTNKSKFITHLFRKLINDYCTNSKDQETKITLPNLNKANVVDCLSYDNLSRLYSKVITDEKKTYYSGRVSENKGNIYSLEKKIGNKRIPISMIKKGRNLFSSITMKVVTHSKNQSTNTEKK